MKNNLFKKVCIILLCFSVLIITGCESKSVIESSTHVQLVKEPVLSESSYSLGDRMGDYSLIDVNGNEYSFSELLSTKKAIVLNFWFINCGPCQMEFPYLQAAADKYSDDIVVLAINPTDDKENKIKNYAISNELSLPFIKGDQDWISAFNLQGFPTTVVIDRYGKIAFSHVGAVTEDGVFENIFAYFTSKDYEHTVIQSINDIK